MSAGRSKCPHEEHTKAVDDPHLNILAYPSPFVFPDEGEITAALIVCDACLWLTIFCIDIHILYSTLLHTHLHIPFTDSIWKDMVFTLELENVGAIGKGRSTYFYLYANHIENDAGLEIILDGISMGLKGANELFFPAGKTPSLELGIKLV